MGNHARVYTFNDLVESGAYDNYKVHSYKKINGEREEKVIPVKIIKRIIYDYFKLKIIHSLYTTLPVLTLMGVFLWTRRKSAQIEQVIFSKDNVHIINKRDQYTRSLVWINSFANARQYRIHYERVLRTDIKTFLDLGLDIPINNYAHELKTCQYSKNFYTAGRYHARTPPGKRITYGPKPNS